MTAPTSSDVAVIVPSIHLDPLVVKCVQTIRASYSQVEIVVLVDDASATQSIDSAAMVVETGPITIAAKRNLGAKLTHSTYLAFIDSDAYPDTGWLEHAVSHLDADATLGAVGGPNISPLVEPTWERYVGLAHQSPLVCGWWTYRKSRSAAARDVPALPSCNLVVRRIDFESVGAMNEVLFTAEDIDFCRRLGLSGRRIRFEPDVVVFHKNRNLKSFVLQRYTFGAALVPLVGKGVVPDPAYTAVSLLPGVLANFLAAGPLVLLVARWRRPWLLATGGYMLLLLAEGARTAPHLRDAPGTAVAIAVGNLAPGVGLTMRALGRSTDLQGIYRNDR